MHYIASLKVINMLTNIVLCKLLHASFITTLAFGQNATGPSSVCEGNNVTLQCVIILTNPDNRTFVQPAMWSRNGMSVQLANGSFIPNHRTEFNLTTGGFTDLVITDVILGDNNTVYSCSATGAPITSSVVLNVTGKKYVHTYVCIYT